MAMIVKIRRMYFRDKLSLSEIARRTSLSRNTVKTHLKRVFRKCEVSSFAQLAALVATGPRRR